MNIENLCIEGGGAKVYASIGVIYDLEERNITKNIKRIIGTSAGSIIATLLALNCKASDIEKYYDLLDLSSYRIKYYSIITYYNLFFKKGIYDSNSLKENVVSKILIEILGRDDITFQEIYSTYSKILVITGSCINKREIHYYHKDSNPNMKVKAAIQISCCVPFLFRPVVWDSDVMVDGAVLTNYPLYFFDDYDNLPNSKIQIVSERKENVSESTIGIKFINSKTKKDESLYSGNDKVDSFMSYIECITNTIVTQIERLSMRKDYWKQTIPIVIDDSITITNMVLDPDSKKKMIQQGKVASIDYFSHTILNTNEF